MRFFRLEKHLVTKGFSTRSRRSGFPILVVGGVAVHFFRKACRESPLRFQAGLETAFALTSRYFIRFKRNPKD